MVIVTAIVVAFALVAAGVTPAAAQMYQWVDDRGVTNYSDFHTIPERFRSRAVPLGLRNAPAPPPGAASAPTGPPTAAGSAAIRYTPGQRILVDVRLNGRTSVRLLLDTGADRTLINPQSLSAAGAPITRAVARGEMRGVTGSSEVVYVIVDSIEIGAARVERVMVAAYEMGSRESDGLLGRDVLDHFNVSIDSSRGVVTLSPK